MASTERHLVDYVDSLDRNGLKGFALELASRTGTTLSYPKDSSDADVRQIILRICQQDERVMKAALKVVDDAWPEEPPRMGFKPN